MSQSRESFPSWRHARGDESGDRRRHLGRPLCRGSSQEERHLSVGDGLLGKIVVNDEAVLAVVSEVLTTGAAGVGGQELKGSSFGGGSGNDDSVLEGIVIL